MHDTMTVGFRHHQQGRLDEAARLYQAVLAQQPGDKHIPTDVLLRRWRIHYDRAPAVTLEAIIAPEGCIARQR